MTCDYCSGQKHTADTCFRRIREQVPLTEVAARYGVRLSERNRSTCPLPKHTGDRNNPTAFSIALKEKGWAFHCFTCKASGNTIEFVQQMGGFSKASDAVKEIAGWYPYGNFVPVKPEIRVTTTPALEKPERNIPLAEKFKDKGWDGTLKLDPAHPYLAARGFSKELCEAFGVGFAAKGKMAGRIAFPIHSFNGLLVGYCGRFVCPPADESERWKFPAGFQSHLELFNLHRVEGQAVVVCESFWGPLSLARAGIENGVALMGRSMSKEQYDLLQQFERVTYLADPGEPGEAAGREIGKRLLEGPWKDVRVVWLRVQTDEMPPEELRAVIQEGPS